MTWYNKYKIILTLKLEFYIDGIFCITKCYDYDLFVEKKFLSVGYNTIIHESFKGSLNWDEKNKPNLK